MYAIRYIQLNSFELLSSDEIGVVILSSVANELTKIPKMFALFAKN